MHSVYAGGGTNRHGACSHLEPPPVQSQQSLPAQVDSAMVLFSYKFQTQQSLPLQVQTLSLQAGNSADASAFGLLGAVPLATQDLTQGPPESRMRTTRQSPIERWQRSREQTVVNPLYSINVPAECWDKVDRRFA